MFQRPSLSSPKIDHPEECTENKQCRGNKKRLRNIVSACFSSTAPAIAPGSSPSPKKSGIRHTVILRHVIAKTKILHQSRQKYREPQSMSPHEAPHQKKALDQKSQRATGKLPMARARYGEKLRKPLNHSENERLNNAGIHERERKNSVRSSLTEYKSIPLRKFARTHFFHFETECELSTAILRTHKFGFKRRSAASFCASSARMSKAIVYSL